MNKLYPRNLRYNWPWEGSWCNCGEGADLFHSVCVCEERQLVGTNECGKVEMCTVIYGPQISWASLLERRPSLDQEVQGRDKLCCWVSLATTAPDLQRHRSYKSWNQPNTHGIWHSRNVFASAVVSKPNSWIFISHMALQIR